MMFWFLYYSYNSLVSIKVPISVHVKYSFNVIRSLLTLRKVHLFVDSSVIIIKRIDYFICRKKLTEFQAYKSTNLLST